MKLFTLPLLLALSASLLSAADSTVPNLLSYQGRVTDTAGALIGNSAPVNRTVQFRLYDVSSGGNALWGETQVVTISGGEFSVLIGNGTGINSSTPGPSSPASPTLTLSALINGRSAEGLYLGIAVSDGTANTPVEISPRQRLVTAAYAFRASVAESVANGGIGTDAIADGQITTNKISANAINGAKIADGSISTADIQDGTIVANDLAAGSVTTDKLASNIAVFSKSSTGISYTDGDVFLGNGSSLLTVNGAIRVANRVSSHTQGAYLEWNKEGTGHTYLLNQRGGGTGGIVFGEITTANALTETMRINANGRVGIGETNPGFPLNFASTLGDKIALWGNSGSYYGFGIRSSVMQIHTNSSAADIAFGYGNSTSDTSMTEVMRIKGNGNVGIGTNSPDQKLTINNGWLSIQTPNGSEGGVKGVMAGSDAWAIYGTGSNNDGALIIATYDDATEPIRFYQSGHYLGGFHADGNFETGENRSIRLNGTYNNDQSDGYLAMSNGAFTINTYNTSQNKGKWRTAIYDGDSNWDFSSDARLKQDITDAEPMLDSLMQVRFRRYRWKGADSTEPTSFGVVAQELEPFFPFLVTDRILPGETETSKTVAYTEFATIAAKAIQELKIRHDAELAALRAQNAALEKRLAALEARLSASE